MLTDQQYEKLRCQLAAMRATLESRLQDLHREAQPVSLELAVGRLTRMDMIQQQRMAAGQQQRLETELRQVMAATNRFERNQYGFCLSCRGPIPYERLKIRPVTALCYDCQQANEARY